MARMTKPGNLERGWNDPPVFLYDGSPAASLPAPAPRRAPLNKRVAFPVTATGGAPGPQLNKPAPVVVPGVSGGLAPSDAPPLGGAAEKPRGVQLLPPSASTDPPLYVAPIIVPAMDGPTLTPLATNPVSGRAVAPAPLSAAQNADLLMPDFDDDNQMFHYVTSRLNRAVRDCEATVEGRVVEDMQRRVDVFAEMWTGGKISYPVKCVMARLATAIHRRRCAAAHELHLALVMDHISEVGRWLVGVKRLIQEVETIAQPTSPSATCLEPALAGGEGVGVEAAVEGHIQVASGADVQAVAEAEIAVASQIKGVFETDIQAAAQTEAEIAAGAETDTHPGIQTDTEAALEDVPPASQAHMGAVKRVEIQIASPSDIGLLVASQGEVQEISCTDTEAI